jgi:hypothetical protein
MADGAKCAGERVRGRRRLALSVLALACVAASPLSTLAWPSQTGKSTGSAVRPVAVFGTDDRGPLPAKYKDMREKMGLLFSVRGRSVCTAFCVAHDVVATAGHCLLKVAGERTPRMGDFWFLRNYDAVRDVAHIAGYTKGMAALNVMVGSMSLNVNPPIEATRDWALVRLARRACTKGVLPIRVLPIEQILKEAEAKRIFQIAYHRDYAQWKLAYAQPCGVSRSFEDTEWSTISRDFSDPEALILHTCDTGGASSGSPLLIDTEGGPTVIGINVGTYEQSKVLMQEGKVMKRMKADAVANTAVASSAFAGKLDTFLQAAVLSSPAQVRELQSLLKGRQLFDGKVDGNYGAELRLAIEAYEKAEGLQVTGLATVAILKRLGGGIVPVGRAKAQRR